MSSNIDLIYARLAADATLLGTPGALPGDPYTGLASGGIYTRMVKRIGDGKTPRAFEGEGEDAQTRPCIVLIDRGDNQHRQQTAIPSAYNQLIWVYFLAPAYQSGKDRVAAMRTRVYELLDHDASGGWTFTSEDGPQVFAHLVGRQGVHDDEIFTDAVADYQRYQLTSRYANLT